MESVDYICLELHQIESSQTKVAIELVCLGTS